MTTPSPAQLEEEPHDDLRSVLRAQLSASARERFDLGYLDPTSRAFALNPVTRHVLDCRAADDARAPLVTFFAQPEPSPSPVDLARLHAWLEPNTHRYDPVPGQLFVPLRVRRAVTDGVLATSHDNAGLARRFLVVRRSGSVELGPGSVLRWPKGEQPWVLASKRLVAQFAQLLRFLIRFADDFARPSDWQMLVNVRGAKAATLGHFATGWAPPLDYPDETTFCLEPHVQLELPFSGNAAEIDACVREAATRLELAFGFWQPRVYNLQSGQLELDDVTY